MTQPHNDQLGSSHLLGAQIALPQPKWQRLSGVVASELSFQQGNMNYAANAPLVPISMPELADATLEMPLAFATLNGVLQLVAVCGLEPGVSLAVNAQGYWQFPYVPAVLGVHPFALSEALNPHQPVVERLWVDLGSTWLVENGSSPVFQANGVPSAMLAAKLELLQHKMPNLERDGPAVRALADAGLLVPWAGLEALGVLCVEQRQLAKLEASVLVKLRDTGGLTVAYAHLLSLGRASRLMECKRRADQAALSGVTLEEMLSAHQDGTLHFS